MSHPEPTESAAAAAEPGCLSFQTAADKRRERRFVLWMLAAALAYVAASAAPRFREGVAVVPWLLLGLALGLAVQTLRSYLAYLRGADELLRRIQIEALALGFAAGVVFSIYYPLFEPLGAPHAGGRATGLVMMVVWSFCVVIGPRRYSESQGR